MRYGYWFDILILWLLSYILDIEVMIDDKFVFSFTFHKIVLFLRMFAAPCAHFFSTF